MAAIEKEKELLEGKLKSVEFLLGEKETELEEAIVRNGKMVEQLDNYRKTVGQLEEEISSKNAELYSLQELYTQAKGESVELLGRAENIERKYHQAAKIGQNQINYLSKEVGARGEEISRLKEEI